MSLGERRRNSLFESEEKEKTNLLEEKKLDSRFVVEPRINAKTHQKIFQEEEVESDTQWKPPRRRGNQGKDEKTQRNVSQDPRFAQELSPDKSRLCRAEEQPKDSRFSLNFEEENTKNPATKQKNLVQKEEISKAKAISSDDSLEDWETPPVYGKPPESFFQVEKTEEPQQEVESKSSANQWQPEKKTELRRKSETNLRKQPIARRDLGGIDRKHDIFFQGTEPQDFREVLTQVQEYISVNYAQLITENPDDSKEQMKRYISKFILDNKVIVEGRNSEELLRNI